VAPETYAQLAGTKIIALDEDTELSAADIG
jgi:hypothetical protein